MSVSIHPQLLDLPSNMSLGDTLAEVLKELSVVEHALCNEEPLPRFLFRVHCSKSDGKSDTKRVQSKAAMLNWSLSGIGILQREDRWQAGKELWHHLMWKYLPNDDFMSWTSSFLFVLQHIRRRNLEGRSPLRDIKVLVVDTTNFRSGAFIRDMVLIDRLREFNQHLEDYYKLRHKQCKEYKPAHYYFGEYISQGILDVEHACTQVTAQDLVDSGFWTLRPDLEAVDGPSTSIGLAKDICRMRQTYYASECSQDLISAEQWKTAERCARLFGARFYLPMLANLLALLPCDLRSPALDSAIEACIPKTLTLKSKLLKSKLNKQWGRPGFHPPMKDPMWQAPRDMHPYIPDHLPEVEQADHIAQRMTVRLNILHATAYIKQVKSSLRSFTVCLDGIKHVNALQTDSDHHFYNDMYSSLEETLQTVGAEVRQVMETLPLPNADRARRTM